MSEFKGALQGISSSPPASTSSPSPTLPPVDLTDLTPNQRKELREALIAAFPDASTLGLMVEDELGESLNIITQGQPNYELAVRDLIKWAEAHGRVQELLSGALQARPGNPKLKKFAGL